jgi:hypothetical protein
MGSGTWSAGEAPLKSKTADQEIGSYKQYTYYFLRAIIHENAVLHREKSGQRQTSPKISPAWLSPVSLLPVLPQSTGPSD